MRILYVIDSLGIGGAETLLLALVTEAVKRGHEVHVAYFTQGGLGPYIAAHAASVTRLGVRGLKDPRVLWRACRLIRRLRPDVVHTHLTKSDLVGQMAARLCGIPVRILTLHNTDPWRKNRFLSAVYRLATQGVGTAIAVSSEVARFTETTHGVAPDRLRVIRNAVDTARFAPVDHTAPDRPFTAAVIGRLQPQKDHATFLHAVRIIKDRHPAARFKIIGDGPLLGQLRDMAAALGLGETVVFTGNLPDMPAVMGDLDAVVLSSAWEGLPMVLLEAMSCGKAVVATAVGEVPAVVKDGENGLLVPARAPEALAEAILSLVTAPELANRLGRAARATVVADYSDSAMFRQIFAVYENQRGKSPLA